MIKGAPSQLGRDGAGVPHLLANSPPMQDIIRRAERAAARTSKVLITGESGVGKDVLACFIHATGIRAQAPFVAVNCAGLTETLLESELFGHTRGSFTGAYRDKPGKLQLADGGTIFLDEVGEMTPRMQALLLRFLESGEVQPVGADRPNRRVDARVIAATNRNLEDMASAGTFRADLLYRIRVLEIQVPPLRQRKEDIRPLAAYFLNRIDPSLALTDAAWQALESYHWPGNVRELQNVVEQLASGPSHAVIDRHDLPAPIRGATGTSRSMIDRRKGVADELFRGITSGSVDFWNDVYRLFMDHDLTRRDLRLIVSKGLAASAGNYRDLVQLFGLPDSDYKRLLGFLTRHDCAVDYRQFRRTRRDLRAGAQAEVASGMCA